MPNLLARPTPKKDMINARIAEHQRMLQESQAEKEAKDKATRQREKINETLTRNRAKSQSRFHRFTAFTEQTEDMLMEHAIHTLAMKALANVDKMQGTNLAETQVQTMHAMAYKFIHESGGAAALIGQMRMHGKTYYLEELCAELTSTFKKIVESVDRNDPDTFKIDNELTEKFRASLESDDSNVMSELISDRVSAAIGEFIEGNKKDKDAIVSALTATKDKIDELNPGEEDIKESYARMGKRFITEVRNRKHGLFNEMVTIVSQDIIKRPELRENYLEGAKLDMNKIVDRVTVMYTFLETVNTMRLVKITPDYIRKHVLGLED